MSKKQRKQLLLLSIIIFSILYFGIILLFIKVDLEMLVNLYEWGNRDLLKPKVFRINFIKRICLAFLEHASCIFYFVTCLLYIKKKKVAFYVCGIPVIISLALCIRFNLPLLLRESFPWRMNWKTDIFEYFYPVSYLGMLILFLFYPAFLDFMQQFCRRKSIAVWVAVLATININIISIIFLIVCIIEDVVSCNYLVPFLAAMFIKAGILFLIYKLVLSMEEIRVEKQKLEGSFILKCIIPFLLVFGIIAMKVTVVKGGFVISRAADIDGYWYIGRIKGFVEHYENPFEDKRNYLDFTYVSNGKLEEEQEGYDWYYDKEVDCYMIKTYERTLESIYYIEPLGYEDWEESNLHKMDLEKFSSYYVDRGERDYRAVLSAKKYENQYFCYRIEKLPFVFVGSVTLDGFIIRDIEEYDIRIEEKEIPAYFLGLVEKFGIVKVEPYTHYWGENYFRMTRDAGELFWPRRQY